MMSKQGSFYGKWQQHDDNDDDDGCKLTIRCPCHNQRICWVQINWIDLNSKEVEEWLNEFWEYVKINY